MKLISNSPEELFTIAPKVVTLYFLSQRANCLQPIEDMMIFDPELLHILACPKCRGTLQLIPVEAKKSPSTVKDNTAQGLLCKNCSVYYPIENDIPVLLIEEANSIILELGDK